jgi:hypothetical protein
MTVCAYQKYYVKNIAGSEEAAPRGRRLILFIKATQLTQIDSNGELARFLEGVQVERAYLDHTSLWSTACGVKILLTEPYQAEAPNVKNGAAIPVPIVISPYCGGFDRGADAMPRTRSWLIASSADAGVLKQLEVCVQATAIRCTKRWNEV